MGLDVWFAEDVARALRAARLAGRAALAEEQIAGSELSPRSELAAYWRGYEAALATIGAAFGLTSASSLARPVEPNEAASGGHVFEGHVLPLPPVAIPLRQE